MATVTKFIATLIRITPTASVLCAALVLSSAGTHCAAQPPGGPQGPEGPPRRPGGPGGERPLLPIMKALDADADGEISAAEIESAATALKSMDKNSDGKLTLDELRPEFARGRQGRRNRPGQAGEGERGPRGPRAGRGRGPAGGVGGEGPSPERMVERMMQFDEDGDGELSKEEMPERLQSMLARVDTDNSDSISKEEITKLAERMKQRGQHGGGRRQGPDGAGPSSPPQPPVE